MKRCPCFDVPACGYGYISGPLARSLTVIDVGTEGRYWVKDNKSDYVKVDASGISVVTSGSGIGFSLGDTTYNYAVRLVKTM